MERLRCFKKYSSYWRQEASGHFNSVEEFKERIFYQRWYAISAMFLREHRSHEISFAGGNVSVTGEL